MARALELGRQVRRLTAPNPWVGSVVVRDGVVVGEGATRPPGGPHAEIVALAAAASGPGARPCSRRLEPCSHHGATGPCVGRVDRCGSRRASSSALEDPDPRSRVVVMPRCARQESTSRSASARRTRRVPPPLHRAPAGTARVRGAQDRDEPRRSRHRGRRRVALDHRRGGARRRARAPRRLAGRHHRFGNRARRPARALGTWSARPLGPPPLRVVLDGDGVPRRASSSTPRARPDPRRHDPDGAGRGPRTRGGRRRERRSSTGADGRRCRPPCSSVPRRRGVLQAFVEGGPTVHGAFLDARPRRLDRRVRGADDLGAGGRAGYGLDPGPALAAASLPAHAAAGSATTFGLEYDVDGAG